MVEINRARVRYLDTALRPYIAGCNGGFTWSRADVHYAGTPTILAHDKKIPSFEQPVIGHGKSAWPIKMVAKRHACLFKLGSEMGVVAIDSNSSAKPYSVLRRWVNHCGSYLDRSPSSTRIPDRACVPRKSELKMLAVERSPVTVNTASCSDVTVAPSCPGTGSSAITLPPLLTSITLVVLRKAAWATLPPSFKAPSTSNRAPGPLIFNVEGVDILDPMLKSWIDTIALSRMFRLPLP